MYRLVLRLVRMVGLYHPLRDWRSRRRFRKRARAERRTWRAAGSPPPPPAGVKHDILRRYARDWRTPVLVETGTWMGETLFMLRRDFRELHSIELDPGLYRAARERLAHLSNVRLHQGDSARVLLSVIEGLSHPILFWLDGHYCSGPSARGDKDTPILDELAILLSRPARGDVVLIDDARLFDGTGSYPTLEEVREVVLEARPSAGFSVEEDVIRIAPI